MFDMCKVPLKVKSKVKIGVKNPSRNNNNGFKIIFAEAICDPIRFKNALCTRKSKSN